MWIAEFTSGAFPALIVIVSVRWRYSSACAWAIPNMTGGGHQHDADCA